MAVTKIGSSQIQDDAIVNSLILNGTIANGKLATNPLARANHTGTQSADTLTDGSTNKAYTADEQTKLAGIATGATANSSDATLLARANHTGAQAISTVTGLQTALDAKEASANKGQASGYASLDGGGKVPTSQLPDSIIGGATYQGTWNADTNTPTLASGTGTQGYYYVVSVAGATALDGITDWKVGDWAIYNGAAWQKVDNTDAVASVFGRLGAVVAVSGDYTASQITNTAAGNIVATTVQAAIDELDSEKAALSSFVDSEVPSGTIDGVNDEFTLANTPVTGSLHLYKNGIRMAPGASFDYTISGLTITFTSGAIPASGSSLLSDYRK